MIQVIAIGRGGGSILWRDAGKDSAGFPYTMETLVKKTIPRIHIFKALLGYDLDLYRVAISADRN